MKTIRTIIRIRWYGRYLAIYCQLFAQPVGFAEHGLRTTALTVGLKPVVTNYCS